jgi:predicted RNA binding protein YcfA (HicA-like mRNA interferase family)
MKIKDVLRLLKDDGWQVARQKGSHRQFRHPTKPGTVTVPVHRLSDELPIGTLKSIMKQAGL